MFITARKLKNRGACFEELQRFSAEWPNGVEVTRESLKRAYDLGLPLAWFAYNFLSVRQYEAFWCYSAKIYFSRNDCFAPEADYKALREVLFPSMSRKKLNLKSKEG